MAGTIQGFVSAWAVDIAFGWSVLDVVSLLLLLLFLGKLINYFFFKAGA